MRTDYARARVCMCVCARAYGGRGGSSRGMGGNSQLKDVLNDHLLATGVMSLVPRNRGKFAQFRIVLPCM